MRLSSKSEASTRTYGSVSLCISLQPCHPEIQTSKSLVGLLFMCVSRSLWKFCSDTCNVNITWWSRGGTSRPAPHFTLLLGGNLLEHCTCSECGGDVRIIPKALASLAGQALASIEDPAVIKKILDYLDDNTPCITTALQPECRAPPLAELLESF